MRSRLLKPLRKSRSQRKKASRHLKGRRRPTFESLESRCLLAASPPLLSTIEGFNIDQAGFNQGGNPWTPPDPYGAAGPAHVLNVGNTSIQWFTKDGTPQVHTSLFNFFAPLSPVMVGGAEMLFDPKVAYDQYEDRFVVLALEMIDTAPFEVSRLMMAVSDDSDPNGNWYYHSINSLLNIDTGTGGTPAILPFWADYPGMGLDEEAIYVTANMFELGGATIGGTRLWIVDKGVGTDGFYDNGSATVTMHDPMADTGVDLQKGLGTAATSDFRNMQPAHVFGNAPAGVGTWLTLYDGNTDQTTDNELVDVIRVDDPLGTPTFTLTTVDVGDIEDPVNFPFPIPPATQKDTTATIDGGDRRTLNAVWRNDSLYTTTVIYPTDGPEINQVTAHWFRFDTSSSDVTLADQGDVSGEDLSFAVHTYWPSVMVDSQDNMAIGFAASGPALYAGAYYAMRAADDDPGTLRDAVAIAEGLDAYDLGGGPDRWGDYSSVALDPSDEVTLWAYNEYALPEQGQGGRWGTRWGSFRMAALPDAPPPGATTISGIKWHDLDDDGRFDADEPVLPGVVIRVDLDGDGQVDFGEPDTTTDEAGRYSITVNTAGTFEVREVLLPGWEQKFPGPDAPTAFAHTITVSEAGGEVFTNVNFGNSNTVGFDRGDAPAPYPTLEADNGPTHPIVAGFGLGDLRDGEPDGLPDATAIGDDTNNLNDDDGVILPDVLVPGSTATASVIVSTGGMAQGRLHGWIDFNRDGDWNDPGEKVFPGDSVGLGTHTINFTVPANAEPGTTFARFRYGYESDLPPTGPSPRGGEVEDYSVNILSDVPIANDDQFTVDQNSANNPLDVLDNDVPSSSGVENLVLETIDWTGASGSGSIDRNGTPADFTDDFISYTPAPGAFGQDAFSYTVQDNVTGDQDTATVVVTIQQTAGTIPVAVDDSFEVTTTTRLDQEMLANDRTGPDPPISILSIDTTGTSGTVTLTGQVVEYTPALGFAGSDQFEYTIIDTNTVTSTAVVTVHVPPHTANDLVSFRLETTDMNGAPITEIGQGLPFQVRVYVDDLRTAQQMAANGFTLADQGVFSAGMDLLYDSRLVSYAGDGNLTGGPEYSIVFVDSSIPGILDDVSGIDSGIAPGPGEQLLLVATYTASAKGTALFRTDPADNLPLHETALWHPEVSLEYEQITFGTTSIEIVESPDLVWLRLEVTDTSANRLPLANNQIVAGNDFMLRAHVEDRRLKDVDRTFPILDLGVFSAYLDVFFDDTLARPVISGNNPFGIEIAFGQLFGSGQKVDTGASGILNEIGAFQGQTAMLFADEELLFEIQYTALTPPTGIGNLIFDADPADFQPLNEVSLIRPDPGVSVPTAQVAYLDSPVITVLAAAGEGEFTNPRNSADVNDDGQASPIDALILINFLNNQGSTDLSALAGGEGESSGSRYYYDVNSDLVISPLDVLGVIGHLNTVGIQGGGEGEANAETAKTVADTTVEATDAPFVIQLTTLDLNETSDLNDDENERPEPPVVVEDDAETKVRGVSPLEELADETAGLLEVLTDDLAEDVLGAWSALPSDQELIAELV